MGKRSRVFIRGNCDQDLIENKENIKEFAMVKVNKKKKPLKNSVIAESVKMSKKTESIGKKKQKSISSMPKTIESIEEEKLAKSSNKAFMKQTTSDKFGDSTNVSRNEKTEKTTKSMLSHNSTQNTKSEFRKQYSSETNKCQIHCANNIPPIAGHPIVVLYRIPYFDEDASSSASTITLDDASDITVKDASDITLKDAGKTEIGHNKCKNDLSQCECHSNLLLKEAVVVLERLDDIQENSAVLKGDGKVKEVPNKSGKGTKRKSEKNKSEDKNSSESTKSKKQKASNESKSSKKEKIPDVTALDFSNDSKSSNGNLWNFKISSWNINGIRAWLEKDGLSYLHHEQPDILCIQETKCSDDKLPDEVKEIDGYHTYWLSGDKDGYSGVGLLTKEKPIKVEYGIGISEHDNEGRVITAEYDKFYLVNTYVPNAGRGLVRLDYRMKWDKDFREYLKKLDADKPIILTGDLNVAHEEIDLANPKTNKKNAGFTKEEREGFSTLLKEGFIDSFRHLYPDVKGAYTFWTYMMNARAKNVGWRLDYFVISERFTENLCDNVIRKDVYGSDHCPITLFLSL